MSMDEVMSIRRMAREFNEMSRNAGMIEFKVRYSATPGNTNVHEAFIKFAAETSNNEYLLAIGKLMEYASLYVMIDERINRLEEKIDEVLVKKEPGVKTF